MSYRQDTTPESVWAARLGLTDDILDALQERTEEEFRRRAKALVSDSEWAFFLARVKSEPGRFEAVIRKFAERFACLLARTAVTHAVRLTEIIIHRRQNTQRIVRWENILGEAVGLIDVFCDWERSKEWLAVWLQSLGYKKRVIHPRWKVLFLLPWQKGLHRGLAIEGIQKEIRYLARIGDCAIPQKVDIEHAKPVYMRAADGLSAVVLENKAIRGKGSGWVSLATPLPTLEQLRAAGKESLSYAEAGAHLRYAKRTIRLKVKARKLIKTPNGRIFLDRKFEKLYRDRNGLKAGSSPD